jgi:hypothetical protein
MMKQFTLLAALVILAGFGFAQNYSIDLSADKHAEEVVVNDFEQLKMEFSYDGVHSFNVKTQKGEFTEIAIPNTYSIGELGAPKLPATKRLIKVPFGAEATAEVVSFDKEVYDLEKHNIKHKIIPMQPSVSKSDDPAAVEFEYDAEAYQKNAFSSHELATVEILGTMRSVRIGRLVVAPVRYNPVTNQITVYNNIKVKVSFENADVAKTEEMESAKASPFFEVAYDKLVNHRSDPDDYPEHPDLTNYPIKYLVVSDPMFEETLAPFIEWKTQQGFTMEVAYTDEIGESYDEVQTWVHDQYNNSDVTPSFLLLVGDIDQIPMEMGSSSGKYTDLYYGSVDGDMFPEMYYGRFSAQTVDQLQAMVDKTLYYEKYEFEDPSYLDRVTLIAGADGTWNPNVGQPTVEYGTENYFNEANGYSTVNDYLTSYNGCYETVDEGVGFINYTAHCNQGSWGDPNLTISDVYEFENENMYPLAVGNCCLAHDIGYSSECIGEAWMRKANGGAVAYLGSAPSTYWFEDFYWSVGAFPISGNNNGYVPTTEETTLGAYDAMFMSDYETVDAKIFVGNLAVTEVDIQGYPQHSSPLYYWQAYMCGGDPSLMLYNTQGEENEVSHMDIVPIGMDMYEVTADPGSYVAISKDGVLHGAALVDESGVVNVPIEPITSGGPVDVVVTGRQKIPYIEEVPAAALEGPYIVMDEAQVDDAGANSNGQIDFGETFDLDVTLKNVGADDSETVTATVTGTDSYITVQDPNTADFGPIVADETSTVDNAYTFDVTDDVPDEHTAQFELEMTDGTEVWTSSLQLTAYAPVLATGNIVVDDAAYGNNNGNLDPGETADLYITTYNNGHADAPTTTANLSTTSDIATITSTVHSFGTFAAQSEDQAVFTIEIDESAEIGSSVELSYSVASGNYDAANTYTLPVGLIIEDFESGDFSGFEWEHSGSTEWFITESAYEGGFAAGSGDIDDDQESVLEISGNVISDGTISFYRKVSSESGYDYLEFHIDGSEVDSWSGDVDWEMVEYDVSTGEHTFTWKYTKDGSVSNEADMGWIDYITFPTMEMPAGPLSANIVASATEMCEGDSVLLQANVSGGNGGFTYSWAPAFTLSDPNASETWAYPTANITYTLTVNDGDAEVTDEVAITVYDTPAAPSISEDGDYLVSSATEGNQWCDHEGNHIEGATEQSFIPEHTGTYHCVVINENGCQSDMSNGIFYGYTNIEDIEENETKIYPNPFSDNTVIEYHMKKRASLKIVVFNSLGKVVNILENSRLKDAGMHTYEVSANNLEEGVYYVIFQSGNEKTTEKLVVVK